MGDLGVFWQAVAVDCWWEMTVLECFNHYSAQRAPEDVVLAAFASVPPNGARFSTVAVSEFAVSAKTGAYCPADEAVVVAMSTSTWHAGGLEGLRVIWTV